MASRGGNQLRIIGGSWRGRRLRFANVPGLRPTSDRNRETLFNWLQPHLHGSRCLDLFAGSGALGFEGASRGAAHVLLVERAAAAARQLKENIRILEAGDRVRLHRGDAIALLKGPPPSSPFDLVFLDPPFDDALLPRACALLEHGGWLAPEALIYLEFRHGNTEPELSAHWHIHRQRVAGQVAYRLMHRGEPPTAL